MADIPFTGKPDGFDRFADQMARGHLIRKGHTLTGYYREIEPGIFRLIRTCGCSDND